MGLDDRIVLADLQGVAVDLLGVAEKVFGIAAPFQSLPLVDVPLHLEREIPPMLNLLLLPSLLLSLLPLHPLHTSPETQGNTEHRQHGQGNDQLFSPRPIPRPLAWNRHLATRQGNRPQIRLHLFRRLVTLLRLLV